MLIKPIKDFFSRGKRKKQSATDTSSHPATTDTQSETQELRNTLRRMQEEYNRVVQDIQDLTELTNRLRAKRKKINQELSAVRTTADGLSLDDFPPFETGPWIRCYPRRK
ncbi:hypothetical protein C0995_000133 [Termitomyces sp. Mi166|nr:hypothetical protein C0995_000133 [Termitomyces sp. Mi166\